MKKRLLPLLILIPLLMWGCAPNDTAPAGDKWDCTVTCAETSTDESYVITYAEAEIISATGALTFQNRNGFDVTVHLLTPGKEEEVFDIFAHGVTALLQVEKDVPYTVGIHADVGEGTEIALVVYDGEYSEPYTIN